MVPSLSPVGAKIRSRELELTTLSQLAVRAASFHRLSTPANPRFSSLLPKADPYSPRSMASAIESLLNYVPRRLALRCRKGADAAAADEFDAAVLFADISGFTDLVDRLSRRGAAGIEELSTSLGGFF